MGKKGQGSNKNPIIDTLQGFSVDTSSDQFSLDQIQASDPKGDLSTVTYTFTDESGSTLLQDTRSISGQQYQEQQLTFNSPVNLVNNEIYTLEVEVQDAGLATGTETRSSSVNTDPIRIVNFQGISVKSGPDRIRIDQAQVQDDDGDLTSVKIEVYNSGDTLVGEITRSASGQQYQEQRIKFTASTDIQRKSQYTVRIIATDSDGDTAVSEVTITPK